MIARRFVTFVSASSIALALFANACAAQEVREPTDAEHNFPMLWQTFDRNYALFGPKRVD